MKKTSFICLLILAVGLLKAQTKHILKFTIEVSDTVTQGEGFNVIYILQATNYSGYAIPNFEGCRVLDQYFPTSTVVKKNQKYHELRCNYRLVTSRTGLLKLPPQSIVVGKKRVYSEAKTIYVRPNPYYGKEMELATQFLCSKGCAPDSCNLLLKQQTAEYILFADDEGRQFVVIAKADYFPYMDNPILAWGRESSVRDLKDSAIQGLLNNYGKQLKRLAKMSEKQPTLTLSSYKPAHSGVAPLLDKIAWGQSEPYNFYCPRISDKDPQKRALVGCVPVAMAQIMAYYKYPLRGRGAFMYSQDDVVYTTNLHLQKFNWNKIKDSYEKTEKDTIAVSSIARLMATASVSVASAFGEEATGANLFNVKTALVNFFGFSPGCCYVRKVPDDVMLGLLYRELDAHRPLILTGFEHAFVCDGYDGDFLHFNMGWRGYSNGYYRAMLLPDISEKQLIFDNMVIGIEPEKEIVSKELYVKTPGTLETLLTNEEKCSVNHLVVSGKLNAADVAILRRMAGAVDDKNYFTWRGTLTTLNLSQAKFVNSKHYYLSHDAKEVGYRAEVYTNVYTTDFSFRKYDFEEMDEDSWKCFCKDKLNKGKGYQITASDGRYFVNYLVERNVIGAFMFKDCDNLQQILLPINTEIIRRNAFMGCSSLKQLTLPESVKEVGDYAFALTPFLRKVSCKNIPVKGKNIFFKSCTYGKGIICE